MFCVTTKASEGPEFYDTEAIDRIVELLERDQGRFSTLLMGVIESAPFQKRRNQAAAPEQPKNRGALPGTSSLEAKGMDPVQAQDGLGPARGGIFGRLPLFRRLNVNR